MLERLKERRISLAKELISGCERLAEMERNTEAMKAQLLRISGAIQVIDDMFEEEQPPQGAESTRA